MKLAGVTYRLTLPSHLILYIPPILSIL